MSNVNITYGSSINRTDTIPLTAKEAIPAARCLAVAVDEETGQAILPKKDGDPVAGLIIRQGRDDIAQGEHFTCQIKNIGLGIASEEVKVGQYVTATTAGKLKKAGSTDFAVGMAVTAAKGDGSYFTVQITKTGAVGGAGE